MGGLTGPHEMLNLCVEMVEVYVTAVNENMSTIEIKLSESE